MKFYLLITGLFAAFSSGAQDSQDAAFVAAYDAYRTSNAQKLEQAAAQIPSSYELAPYVESYRLRLAMNKNDFSGLPAFLKRQDSSYVAERLRADWIRRVGKLSQWDIVDAEYPKLLAPETDVSCYQQQARLSRGDKTVLDEAQSLWTNTLELPEACRPVLDALVIAGRVKADDVWERARKQFEINRPKHAKLTLFYLPEKQMPDPKVLDKLLNSPMAYLVRQPANWSSTRVGRELAAVAIQKVASNDPAIAAQQLEKFKGQMQDDEVRWAWSQIALNAAKRHMPQAAQWYTAAGKTLLSEDNHEWKVRTALRTKSWKVVQEAIQAMPADLAAKPEWIYWLGRAYKAANRKADANALFEKIAGQANFYGNLADEELGRTVMPPPKAKAPNPEEQKAARANPALNRALAFFRLNMRLEGVREWNWALRSMNDRELLAAAELAERNQIWDRAINTADRTKGEHDYALRFLSPYIEEVRPAAREQSLDDAWVYGLIRQESRFVTNARSSAGASGLMQLMPATAKWVAKKIGIQDYNHRRVNDTDINILLGTSYMRIVLESLDNHPVLASAAYNAGPGRARKWRASYPLEGAIYAETIPFNETRDYVKKVMSNTIYYSALFRGKPDSLKARLGTVNPISRPTPRDSKIP